MQTNTVTAGTADVSSPAIAPQYVSVMEKYTDEQVRQFVAALEEPFDPGAVKWRVTNTTSDRRRGQVIAYADPRAYTDRLNALFTVRGWTREYAVQSHPELRAQRPRGTRMHHFRKDCRDLQVNNRWLGIAQRPGRGVGR
jgi:hypothetical protein